MKIEWKDGDAPRLIGAMQILLHFLACYAAGNQPSEEAQAVATKWAEDLQAICKRPLTGAYDALRQAEAKVKDREAEIADLCRAWTPPPTEQLTLFANGEPIDTLPAPVPSDVAELTREASEPVAEFGAEEQDAIDRAQARLVEAVAKLEKAILETHAAGHSSRLTVLRIVANQGLGQDDADRKAVHADLVARELLWKTGRLSFEVTDLGRAVLEGRPEEAVAGWPGREAIRNALLEAAEAGANNAVEAATQVSFEHLWGKHWDAMLAEWERLGEEGELFRREGYGGWFTKREQTAGVA